jgi:hypothetical protein
MRLALFQPHCPGIMSRCVASGIALVALRLPNACCSARGETDLRHHRDALQPSSNGSSITLTPHPHPAQCASPKSRHFPSQLALLVLACPAQGACVSPGMRPARKPFAINNFMRGFKEYTSPGRQFVSLHQHVCLIILVLHFLFLFSHLLLTVRAGPRSALSILHLFYRTFYCLQRRLTFTFHDTFTRYTI